MFKFLMPLITVMAFVTIPFQVGATTSNVSKSGLALEGFDPVSYFRPDAAKDGPLKGDPEFEAKVDDSTFRFSSKPNMLEFLKDPAKYIPAFGGWCAYAVAKKAKKVPVNVKSFLVQDGRLLLFYKDFLNDTRDDWQNTESKSPPNYLKDADANWPKIKDKAP